MAFHFTKKKVVTSLKIRQLGKTTNLNSEHQIGLCVCWRGGGKGQRIFTLHIPGKSELKFLQVDSVLVKSPV